MIDLVNANSVFKGPEGLFVYAGLDHRDFLKPSFMMMPFWHI